MSEETQKKSGPGAVIFFGLVVVLCCAALIKNTTVVGAIGFVYIAIVVIWLISKVVGASKRGKATAEAEPSRSE